MKIAKRIISFMMAMIILASFFCYNVGATDILTVLYPRDNKFVRKYFSDTEAYALVIIRDWAEEENTTDLRASTYAHIDDYVDLPYFYDVSANLILTVRLADGSVTEIYDVGLSDPESGTVDASARGTECLNYEEHSEIVHFETSHCVDVYFASFDKNGNLVESWVLGDGPIIEIKTATDS